MARAKHSLTNIKGFHEARARRRELALPRVKLASQLERLRQVVRILGNPTALVDCNRLVNFAERATHVSSGGTRAGDIYQAGGDVRMFHSQRPLADGQRAFK